MIIPSGPVRVMLAIKPVDFRKGADGLAALVKEEMRADPFCGVIYVFRAKRADRLKLIFWGEKRSGGAGLICPVDRSKRRTPAA